MRKLSALVVAVLAIGVSPTLASARLQPLTIKRADAAIARYWLSEPGVGIRYGHCKRISAMKLTCSDSIQVSADPKIQMWAPVIENAILLHNQVRILFVS